jgi:chromate transporter
MTRPNLLTLFLSFFKIGLFTLGGGYAMLPLIQREVVEKHNWMDEETFVDGIAASQACPGAIAVNLSVYAGYHIAGWAGLYLAVLGTVLPSFFVILLVALSFSNWSDLPLVQKAFHGLRPAVTALIAVPVFQIAKKSNLKWFHYWLPVVAILLIVKFNFSPIYLIIFTILLAWITYLNKNLKMRKGSV